MCGKTRIIALPTLKFSGCVSNEILLLCFLTLAIALSLLSTSKATLFKCSREKDPALLFFFFLSKRSGGQDDHNMDVYLQHRLQAPHKVKRHFTLVTLWWADGRTDT